MHQSSMWFHFSSLPCVPCGPSVSPVDHNQWYSPGLWDDSKCDELDRAFSIHERDEKWRRSVNFCIEEIRPKCRVEGKSKIDSKEIV